MAQDHALAVQKDLNWDIDKSFFMPSHTQKMQNDNSFIESLIKASSLEAAYAILNQKLKNSGFEKVLYSSFVHSPGEKLSSNSMIVIADFPKEWMKRYREKNYISKSYTVKHCLRSYDPIIWKNSAELKKCSKDQIIIAKERWDYGLRTGVTFPLHLPNGGSPSILSISYSDKDKSFKKYVENNIDSIHLTGIYFDAIIRSRFVLPPPQPIFLPYQNASKRFFSGYIPINQARKLAPSWEFLNERSIFTFA